jgi:hypothetical protein
LQGFWASRHDLIEFKGDTLCFSPFRLGERYLYEIKGDNVYLKERLDFTNEYRPDTLKYPFLFGEIKQKGNKDIYIQTSFFSMVIADEYAYFDKFQKLHSGRNKSNRLQLSHHNGWVRGFDIEIDSLGNILATLGPLDDDFFKKSETHIIKIPKKQANDIFDLISKVDLNKIESDYNTNCRDCSVYGFVFYQDNKILKKIYTSGESGPPSLNLLQNYFIKFANQLKVHQNNYTKTKAKFFESQEILLDSNLYSIIQYRSNFDSIRYKLPKYNDSLVYKIIKKHVRLITKDQVCFDLVLDSMGRITHVEFTDSIYNNKNLDYQLNNIKSIQPAIFEGKKVSFTDYNCIFGD